MILPASQAASGSPASASYKVGQLVITAPWARATPKGAPVAGGYLQVTNNGSEPDRLIGGTFPDASKVEVHNMTMANGVMQMRPVAGGLEIKPGQTVELKPGGYHLMFMQFHGQLKAGEQVKGSLTFAKAGTVSLTYQVLPMGAPGPASGHGAGHAMDMPMDMPMHMHMHH
jgi:copper(I)-binding protein